MIYAGDAGIFKLCNKCGIPRAASEFHKNPLGAMGLASTCADCRNLSSRIRHSENDEDIRLRRRNKRASCIDEARSKERQRAEGRRRARNALKLGSTIACQRCGEDCIANGALQKYCEPCSKENQRANLRRWNLENAVDLKSKRRDARRQSPDRHRAYDKRWKSSNREKVNAAERCRMSDPKRRVDKAMSRAIRRCLASGKQGHSWEALVGYSLADLIAHLESKFLDGMTWDTYGQWHIDHIVPKTVFNYTDAGHIDFKRAWALENLQPLWEIDNKTKSDKLSAPFQPSLAIR